MPCYHPLPAWRTRAGSVVLGKEPADSEQLHLPCGGCLGCRTEKAKEWALRAMLELQAHNRGATFTTLTYAQENKPPTLRKRDLQLFLKRFRKEMGPARPIRFLASGEYGEQTNRPHYHAVLYNTEENDAPVIDHTWRLGNTQTYQATPATIAYVAGYTAKKIGYKALAAEEQIDYETGELYNWQPPFLQMSRRPGLGGHAKTHRESWRTFAVNNGEKQRVPRYLHKAWKDAATPEELETLAYETYQHTKAKDKSPERSQAAEKIAIAKQKLHADRRHKL